MKARWLLLGAALSMLFSTRVALADSVKVRVDGANVLYPSVYRAVATTGDGLTLDEAGAKLAQTRVENFLVASGYELATVSSTIVDDWIVLTVDEGKVGRVIVHGQGTVNTLSAIYELTPYGHVFNRLALEDGLRDIQRRFDLTRAHWDLIVPKHEKEHLQLFHVDDSRPELHIYLDGADFQTGFALDVSADIRRLDLVGDYKNQNLLLDGDRWGLGVELGALYFRDLDSEDGRFGPSIAGIDGRYWTPGFHWLRGLVEGEERWHRAQRRDLNIYSYNFNYAALSLSAAAAWQNILSVSLGLGVRHRALFDIDEVLSPGELPTNDVNELDTFVQGYGTWTLAGDNQRLDRQHTLDLDVTLSLAKDGPNNAGLAYDGAFAFGYNELLLSLSGRLVGGSYTVAEAIPMTSRYLRGVFVERYFMERVVAASGEFNLSLARDILRVGAFVDTAVFNEDDRDGYRPVRFGIASGPGIHILILDVFQLGLFYAFGFVSEPAFAHNVSLRLEKAF